MTETGWPLIPREVLPAPVKRAKIPRLPVPPGDDPGRQLSIFGAETTEPSPADLAGLLAGPGRIGRMGGTARVLVRVDAAWRVHVLVAELVSRGLVVNWQKIQEEDVRDDVPPIVAELSRSSEKQVKEETSVPRPSITTTFDPDADPTPDLPSDVDFFPDADPPAAPAGRSAPRRPPPADRHPTSPPDEPDAQPPAEPGAQPPAEPEAQPPADQPTLHSSDRSTTEPDAGPADGVEAADEEPELPETPRLPTFEVTTAYSSRLNALARAWPEAAAQLFLSGPRLRLWVAAAGEPVPGGYALGLDPAKSPDELPAIDAALVRAGLAGRVTEDGRHYIIAGRRRLRRLAELVGERPAAAPPELWPGGAAA